MGFRLLNYVIVRILLQTKQSLLNRKIKLYLIRKTKPANKQTLDVMVKRKKIFWIISGLAAISFGTILFLTSHFIYQSFTENKYQNFLFMAQKSTQNMASHLNRAQEKSRKTIWRLAHDPAFHSLALQQNWEQLGNKLLELYSAVQGLFFYYCPGQDEIMLPKATIHYNFLKNLFPLLGSRKKAEKDIFYIQVQGNHLIVQTHSVHYADKHLGTLLSVCDLARAVAAAPEPRPTTEHEGFYLADTSGFKHAVDQKYIFPARGTRQTLCLGDQARIDRATLKSGLTPVPGYPGLVRHSPPEALYETFRSMKHKMFLLALFFLGFSTLCCYMVFTYMSNQVSELTTQLKKLPHKENNAQFLTPKGAISSLDQWVHQFNTVLKSLKAEQEKIVQKAGQQLDAAQKRYEILVETSPSGLLFINTEGNPSYTNPAFSNLSGYTTKELRQLGAEKIFMQNQFPESELFKTLAATFEERTEFKLLRKDGSLVWVEARVVQVSQEGYPAYIVNLVDISQRKTAQREVEQERERLSLILDGNPIPTFVIGPHKKVLFWNKACQNLTNVAKEKVCFQKLQPSIFYRDPSKPLLADLVLDMDFKEMEKWYGNQGLKVNSTIPEAFEVTTTLFLKNTERTVYSLAARLRDKHGNILGAIETLQDVSEKEELTRQLEHSQKMQAVGTLAGGMAHEFNNILAVIKGYTGLLLNQTEPESKHGQYSREIKKACQRAAALTSNMLTFSRHHKSKNKPVTIRGVLNSVEALLSQTLGPDIELDFFVEKDLPRVLAQSNQLEQVIINLLVNARDAMPKGGVIKVLAQKKTLDKHFCRTQVDLTPGDYVTIQVADTGGGIKPEIRQKIFEPFFTTKEPGKGTGLGLSIVYSIIKNFSGFIRCKSKPGEGSTFTIFLPVHSKAPSQPKSREKTTTIGKRGGGRSILVVDDERQIRQIIKEILTSQGYVIKTAAHGKEALLVYGDFLKRNKPFDLVILDLAMPVMDGPTCLKALYKIHPKAKVLITTGYSTESLSNSFELPDAAGLLNKPFDLPQLIKAVESGLGHKQNN